MTLSGQLDYALSVQEASVALSDFIADREKLDASRYRRRVEFIVARNQATGRICLEYIKVVFEPKPEELPAPAPAFL